MSMTNIRTLTVLLVQTVRHSHWSYDKNRTLIQVQSLKHIVEWLHFWKSFDGSSCGKTMCVNIAGWRTYGDYCYIIKTDRSEERKNACHTCIPEQHVCNHKRGRGKVHVAQEPAGSLKRASEILIYCSIMSVCVYVWERNREFSAFTFIHIYSICEFHFNKSTLFPFL